jgi:hypothetical protein
VAEVLIEGRRLDVKEKLDFSFNYSVADIRDPSKRNTEYSKTIQCPSTANNDKLFGQIFDVNISNPYDSTSLNVEVNFNPNKKAEARVISDGVEVFAGVVQLRKVKIKSSNYIYEVVFIGRLINIFSVLENNLLSDFDDVNGVRNYHIDLSTYDHIYDRPTQAASWSLPVGSGYVYPMIDWGLSDFYTSSSERIYDVVDFHPAVYTKQMVDSIFNFAGFTYTSTFFNSTFFKRLIIPLTKELTLPDVAANTRTFKAVKTVEQMLHRLSTQFPNTYGNEQYFLNTEIMAKLCFEDEAILGFDNNDQYQMLSTPGNLYNIDADGNYIFKCQEVERRDLFRASVDLKLTENYAFTLTHPTYDGVMQLVHYDDSTSTLNVVEETAWSWSITGVVGTVATQTVYVEGEVTTRLDDQVYIRFVADDPDTGYRTDFRIMIGGTVRLDFRCTGGYFENAPVQNHLYEGDTMTLSDYLPDVGMKEFFMGLVNMFNLYVTVDPTNETNLLIETRDDFYTGGITRDWTKKLARDKDITLEPVGLLTAGEYIYTYSEDGDYYNKRYEDNHGHVYGRRCVNVDNDFLNNTHDTEIVFSATPLVNDNPSNRIIPKIYDSDIDEGAMPTDANIRILYYGGLLTSNPVWHHKSIPGDIQRATYPYAGHLTHPIAPAQDINFGLTNEIYYSENSFTGSLLVTNNNLYNAFYRNHVNEITSKDSKVLTGLFDLTEWDISKLDFRDQILIDNSYWRLNTVKNYNPFKRGLTKVELIKILEVVSLKTETFAVGSQGHSTTTNEKPPKVATLLRKNLNQYPEFHGSVSGKRNRVRDSTTFFKIIGNDNYVADGCRNVTILGDSNKVEAGLENVVIINSDGQTVTESNTTIIDGKRQWIHVDKDDDYTARDREFILCDCTSKVVTITLPPVADSTDVRIQVLKTDVSASGVVVDGDGSETINGSTTYNLGSQYDFVSIWCDGVEWFITE